MTGNTQISIDKVPEWIRTSNNKYVRFGTGVQQSTNNQINTLVYLAQAIYAN